MILAFFTLFAGGLGVPHLFSEFLPGQAPHWLSIHLKGFAVKTFTGSAVTEGFLMGGSVLVSLVTAGLTARYFLSPKAGKAPAGRLGRLLEEAFYVEHFLKNFAVTPFKNLSAVLYESVDIKLIQNGVRFLALQALSLKKTFSSWQDGNIQSYAFYFVIGLGFLMTLIFIR